MSQTYNPNDVFIVQRNSTSSSFVERVLSSSASSLVFFNSASILTSLSTSSFTSSFAQTSSWTYGGVNGLTATRSFTDMSASVTHSVHISNGLIVNWLVA